MAKPLPGREIEVEGWNRAWTMGPDPPFHMKSVNEGLQKYSNLLFDVDGSKRIFVPLCGKSVDLLYLADLGHEVVGVEYHEIGVESFFKENNLAFTKEQLKKAPFVFYKASDKNITIYRGDLFHMTPDVCGLFDAFWDRGSYVAINMPQRREYANLMFTLMKPTARYLTEVVSYDGSKFAGPPHYVTDEDLGETFGRKCSIEFLGSEESRKPSHAPADLDFRSVHYIIKPLDSNL